jgi:hypothetical protein
MKKIITVLNDFIASHSASLVVVGGEVFLRKMTSITTIWVFNFTFSEKFNGYTQFKNACNIRLLGERIRARLVSWGTCRRVPSVHELLLT